MDMVDLFERALGVLPGPFADLVRRAREKDVPLVAAALAFYGLVAVPPTLIFVVWAVSLVLGDEQVQRLGDVAGGVAPASLGVADAVVRVAELGSRLGVVALLAGLWPASSYGSALARAFHALDPSGGEEPFPGLRGRVLLVAILPVLVVGGLVASLLGTTLLPDALSTPYLRLPVALVTGFTGATAVMSLLYLVFAPGQRERLRLVRSALLAAAGVSMISVALTAYLRMGADFERHYATSSLAGVVLVAMWLYLFHVLLLGGYALAREVPR